MARLAAAKMIVASLKGDQAAYVEAAELVEDKAELVNALVGYAQHVLEVGTGSREDALLYAADQAVLAELGSITEEGA